MKEVNEFHILQKKRKVNKILMLQRRRFAIDQSAGPGISNSDAHSTHPATASFRSTAVDARQGCEWDEAEWRGDEDGPSGQPTVIEETIGGGAWLE